MKLYPIFADLRHRTVLVVGGGDVAARKVATLLDTGARVRVGAPRLNEALQRGRDAGSIAYLPGEFDPAWLDDCWLVIAATNDPVANRRIAAAAGAPRILVNVVA